ncbi:TonB-dependent receptor domain-containing protein [Aquimarina sp. W85]|uniref:TonB-dependent receptor domain-containing protein n=1 Tax=Aquimarina rhodophyticola TaxID=3342246 RepID=UPI00366B9468
MKKSTQYFTAICIVFLTYFANAQPQNSIMLGSVKGQVVDKISKEPIPYATISIHDSKNTIISGGITTEIGSFVLNDISRGTYILKIQFIGYETYTSSLSIQRKNENFDLGIIALNEEITSLDDVTIVAERTTIEQKIDRKVINVGKDLTTTGGSAAEIMNNIPSVNIDQDGNISLRGNQNVRILLDGKPTNISAEQLLKQLPSTSIKSIELITNPSAKYNPEGMSGIINIILHKNSTIGLNGNINVGLNFDENARFNSSIDLNYRSGKFNLFGNYGNTTRKNSQAGFILREDEQSQQVFSFLDNTKSHLFKIGIDYYLNDHNIVSLYTNQNLYKGNTTGITDILFTNFSQDNVSQLLINEGENTTSTYNFDYKHTFKDEEHTIELEVDYNTLDQNKSDEFLFESTSPSVKNYIDRIDNKRENTTINLDYINPISETDKLEVGYEARLRRTENRYISSLFPNSQYAYDRDIHSGYITYGKKLEQWSYQIGARVESYEVTATLDNQKIFEDDYITVYPSAYISYAPEEDNSYQLSYSRRVDRPGLNQVNPIREWSTPRITSVGNPALDPQFTNSIEFNYTRKLEKGSFTAGAFYRLVNDEINQRLLENPAIENGQILTYDNFENNTAYGFELSSQYKVSAWWRVNASLDFYGQTQKGVVEQTAREVNAFVYNFKISNSFKATKKISFQLFGFYRGPQEGIQFKTKELYFINTGARYNFLEGKGTFSINFNDIFNTQKFRFSSNIPYPQQGQFQGETQTIYLGLSYRFGSGKNRKVARKNRDSNEKSGGGIL